MQPRTAFLIVFLVGFVGVVIYTQVDKANSGLLFALAFALLVGAAAAYKWNEVSAFFAQEDERIKREEAKEEERREVEGRWGRRYRPDLRKWGSAGRLHGK